ncbi:MAG: DUF2207 domain-containing protein [Candidatus Diapherotrites archaeon]|nr:DUF2207 domain-containing protein [Candidatus Diapherotrites archaeon]
MSIKEEEFYIEPPYKYRPSIAQYLTELDVNERAFFADLLHLDRKKNINIERYEKDRLIIRLISDKDLTDSEIYLWQFLKRFEKKRGKKRGLVELRREHITKSTIEYYAFLVRKNYIRKFYLHFTRSFSLIWLFPLFLISKIPTKSENYLPLIKFCYAIFGFIAGLLNTALFFLFIPCGLLKIIRSPAELRTLLRRFVLRYLKITVIFFLVLAGAWVITNVALFVGSGLSALLEQYSGTDAAAIFSIVLLLWIFVTSISLILVFAVFFYFFGVFIVDFITWLFENKRALQHREQWLKFKAFICDYSALEDKPLKYYELWDEFYYYALAVGAIKRIKFT